MSETQKDLCRIIAVFVVTLSAILIVIRFAADIDAVDAKPDLDKCSQEFVECIRFTNENDFGGDSGLRKMAIEECIKAIGGCK